MLAVSADALIEKTAGLRRLWLAMALLLSIYNLVTRLIESFDNEQISLTQIAIWLVPYVDDTDILSIGTRDTDITVQAARRTVVGLGGDKDGRDE